MLGTEKAWAHVWKQSNCTPQNPATVMIVIPTIRGREDSLERAMMSIRDETVSFTVSLSNGNGIHPSIARNTAVHGFGEFIEWIAFLDDDDEFYPGHLTKLVRHAGETGADVVYPWFDIETSRGIENNLDPLKAFGKPFDGDRLNRNNFIPVTALVRSTLFRQVGGFPRPNTEAWPHKDCEDWGLWLRLRDAGATFSHLPERTWKWRWHSRNTTGQPNKARELYP